MADSKTERQLNLLFLLLNTVMPVEREEIRRRIPGYFDKSNEAFERMFERDKEDLRELGIPIETVSVDQFHDDVSGYRINKSDWLLPEIKLTAAERTLLNLASAAWSQALVGSAIDTAIHRLADKQEINQVFHFDLARQGEYLETILQAQGQGKCVTFNYYSINSATESTRVVAPWRIFLSAGDSYLIGFDQDKGEQRVFKLNRVIGKINLSDEDLIEKSPADLSASQIVASWRDFTEQNVSAELKVLPGRAGELRLLADRIEYGGTHDVLFISTGNLDALARTIAKNCDSVSVIKPVSLKNQVDSMINMVRL